MLTKEERIGRRVDQVVGQKTIDKSKSELLFELKDHLDPRRQYTIKVLQAIAEENGVPIKKTVDKIEEGWAGKPMGLYHELWLLGHIEEVDGKVPPPNK